MAVRLVVAVTDGDWFNHLSARADLEEVNFWAEYSSDKRPFPLNLLSIRRYLDSRAPVQHSDVGLNPTPQPKNRRRPARLFGQLLTLGRRLSCRFHQGRSRSYW